MKKLLLILSFAALFSAPAAYAQAVSVDVNTTVNATTSGSASGDHRNENGQASTSNSAHASTSASVSGNVTAAAHRSAVATFVQSLRKTADRDGGIGAEVRAVAQSQNDSASTTATAMTKIENRGKLASFLIGTDWKSIGSLRSAIAQNTADLRTLESSLSVTTDASVRAELEAEIQTLKDQQERLENFVTSHEKSFSLFGWFTKLFVRSET